MWVGVTGDGLETEIPTFNERFWKVLGLADDRNKAATIKPSEWFHRR